jgi:plastocyanin
MGLVFWVAVLVLQDGSVGGVVRLGHRPPPPLMHDQDQDPSLPKTILDNSLVLGRGNEIRDALVVVHGVPRRKLPSSLPVTVEIRNAQHEPRVVALLTGQPVRHVNRDSTTHNVHSLATLNREKNDGLHPPSGEATRTFERAELYIPVRCDIHEPWELSRIHVFDHPYFAVTDAQGRFDIQGVPPGTYTVEVHHEWCQPFQATVKVAEGQTARLDVDLATIGGPPPLRWKPYAAGGAAGVAALLAVLILLARRK